MLILPVLSHVVCEVLISAGRDTVHILPHITLSALKRAHDEDAQAVVR